MKSSKTWTDQINKNCRRCQLGDETLNHVLTSCPAQKKEIVGRHSEVPDHIEKWIPDHVTFFSEQRFGDCQPDSVIETDTQYVIADIKISNENPSLWNRIHSNNATKYEKLKSSLPTEESQQLLRHFSLDAWDRPQCRALKL